MESNPLTIHKNNKMKKRIEKFIKEYKLNISRTEEKIKELEKELEGDRAKFRVAISFEKAFWLTEVAETKRELKVQEKKKMILVQAKSDFECLLPHA